MPLTPPQAYRKTAFTHRRGTAAARPAAADVLAGTLYFASDTLVLTRSTGVAWESYSGGAVPTFTTGSVIFAGASGELAQDNTNLFFDDTNNFLRVPKIVGGPGTTDDLILQATSGVGTTGSWIFFKGGNNGAITGMEMNHLGEIGIGTTGVRSLGRPLTINGTGPDIGYVIEARGNTSAYIQMIAGGNSNQAAGFSFFQAANNVEWRMAVVGNDSNAMRFGTATSTQMFYLSTTGNLLIGANLDPASGTACIIFADGTLPATLDTNSAGLFADDVGGTVEMFAVNEAGKYFQLTGLKARCTAQFDKTNDAALANVTGLSINLLAGRSYAFEAQLFVDADVTGGHQYAIAGTATATSIKYQIESTDNTLLVFVITSRQVALAGAAGQAGSTVVHTIIKGQIVVNAAGTLTVQFAQNAATPATTSSVLTNSTLVAQEII